MSIPVVNRALAILLLAIAIPASGAFAAELGPPADRTLTLYADGQALVREQRAAKLERGRNRVVVRQLPRGIDTTSIRVEARGVTLTEVRDGLSPHRLSTLPPAAQESAVVPIQGRNGEAIGEWILETEQRLEAPITVTYLVSGIQYSASLDIVLERQGGIQLDGWVSIRNGLGLAFDAARVVLVTTPARRTQRDLNPPHTVPRREVELAERVTLPAGQSRRVRVLDRRVAAKPERIVVEGGRLQKHEQQLEVDQRMQQGRLGTQPVWAETRRRLDPKDLAAIVRVLPSATRRIYRETPLGPELLYEDTIDPASMSRSLTLARNSELRVRRRQLQFVQRKDPQETEETIEIVVGNEGRESVQVELLEHLFRSPNFEILAASRKLAPGAGGEASLALGVLAIEPGQQAKLTYTVLYRP